VGTENSVLRRAGHGWHDRLMIVSVLYRMLRHLVELIVWRRRSDDRNAGESLVPPHELIVLRRQGSRPRQSPTESWPRTEVCSPQAPRLARRARRRRSGLGPG
jgi:hypothetical protein